MTDSDDRFEKACLRANKDLDSDKHFFERRPHRRYRIHRAPPRLRRSDSSVSARRGCRQACVGFRSFAKSCPASGSDCLSQARGMPKQI